MKKALASTILLIWIGISHAQIIINEASNRNYTQISDTDGNQHDWFELYNSSNANINIGTWSISDKRDKSTKWVFPDYSFKAGSHLLVFASGLDIKKAILVDHWESAVLPTDTFKYIEPKLEIPNWNTLEFNDSNWGKGIAGFGFSDGDDNTVTSTTSPVVYIRKVFNIIDTAAIYEAILHVDYDDGFVAYLNGIEIARMYIDDIPTWNSLATADHTAQMWQGQNPEKFELDMSLIKNIWKQGDNVLALEVHNRRETSTDLSLIPFLSFGIITSETLFQPVPSWFTSFSGVNLHTNFKIDPDGETLFLSKPNGVITDSLVIPRIPLNSSFGRVTDGAADLGVFLVSTPGESNNSSQAFTNGYEPAPQFSIEAGFYASTQTLTISDSSTTAEIRYTTDGSEPTKTSKIYNGTAITISKTTTLRAKCYSLDKKLPGNTATATYFINATHVLPVISITTNNDNLYGSTGIFDNTNEDWNKPCYIEYFDDEKKLAFNQDAGIQIDGGAGGSRTHPQHSVRIEPGNGTFGDGNVKYNLIPDRPNRENYSSFYLRNGSNQYNTLQYKDGLEVKAIAKNTYTYYSAHTPIVAYINGEYFGVYELREKLNAEFFAENYLMDNDSLDLLSLSYYKGLILDAIEGSTDACQRDYQKFISLSPTSSSYLAEVSTILDLNNYTDYIIAQSWIGNTDWPNNNIRVFRNKSTNYKWQFAVQDVEWSLEPNGWSTATTDHIEYLLTQPTNIPYSRFWLELIKNKDYRVSFINRFADLMNTNYLFSNIGPMENEMYKLQYPEMEAEFERWGNSSMAQYTYNHNVLRKQLSSRSENVREHLQNHFELSKQVEVTLDVQPTGAGQIKISTITPTYYPWSGIYFSNNTVKVTALPNLGYKFVGWENNELIDDLSDQEFVTTLTHNHENFIAIFEPSNENFSGVTISEIHYKNGLDENSTDWIEIYNSTNAQINLEGWYFTDNDSVNKFVFGEKDVLESNARLVIAKKQSDFIQNYPDILNFTGPFDFKLGSPLDAVKLYNSSNKLITAVNYSDFFPWPLNGDETGRTLELRNPAGNLSDPSNWFAGCIGGSPGKAFDPCAPEIVDNIAQRQTNISINAYPIPANDYVNLDISLVNNSKNCMLKIYNVLGSELKMINFGSIEAGNYSTTIDLLDLPSGLLIMDFQSDNIKQSIKIFHLE